MMKRAAIALMAIGPMMGCTATMQDMMGVSSAYEAGGDTGGRNWVVASDSKAPVQAGTSKKTAKLSKSPEQQAREKALAEQVEYEEAVAKAPWRGWSGDRIEQVARDNAIYPFLLAVDERDGKQPAFMMGININMGEVRVGENVYGDQVLESAMYMEPFRDNPNGSAALVCSRGLMDIGMGPQLVQKWTAFGTINREWIAFGTICQMAKAMQ